MRMDHRQRGECAVDLLQLRRNGHGYLPVGISDRATVCFLCGQEALCAGQSIYLSLIHISPAASENESKPAEGNDTISFPLETPETFSMFAIVNGDVALPDCLAWQEVEAQTNVKWDIQSALGVEIEEKKNLLLNSGKYPDVFYKANLTPDQVNKYGAEGVFIALNDLIDQYCPNLKAEMAKRPGAEERITAPDGNIYSLPFLGLSLIHIFLWIPVGGLC